MNTVYTHVGIPDFVITSKGVVVTEYLLYIVCSHI